MDRDEVDVAVDLEDDSEYVVEDDDADDAEDDAVDVDEEVDSGLGRGVCALSLPPTFAFTPAKGD